MIDRWHEPRYADAESKEYYKALRDGWEPYAVTHRVEEFRLTPMSTPREITYIMHWFRKKMTEDEAQQAIEKEEVL
jgi:hypothetical protein